MRSGPPDLLQEHRRGLRAPVTTAPPGMSHFGARKREKPARAEGSLGSGSPTTFWSGQGDGASRNKSPERCSQLEQDAAHHQTLGYCFHHGISTERERKGTPRPENPTPPPPPPRRAEPLEHEAAPPRCHGRPGDATSHDRAPHRSSSSPPRPARSSEDTNTTPRGGNDGAYSKRHGGRHRPNHLQPEKLGRRRRTALDLRSAADLRSAPGHHDPTYEGRKPKLQGTPVPHLCQSQPANAGGKASDRAVADGSSRSTVARARGWGARRRQTPRKVNYSHFHTTCHLGSSIYDDYFLEVG
jgi:hypothetical protein